MNIKWERSNKRQYTAYASINGESTSVTVFSDGSFKGKKINNTDGRIYSFISGKCENVESAMDYVEQSINSLYNNTVKPVIKKSENIIKPEIVEDVIPNVIDDNTISVEEFKIDKPSINIIESANKRDISFACSEDNGIVNVSLISANGNKMKYVFNDKEINAQSKVYKESFNAPKGTVVKVKSYDESKQEVDSLIFTI